MDSLSWINAQPAEKIVAITASDKMHQSMVAHFGHKFMTASHQQVVVYNWLHLPAGGIVEESHQDKTAREAVAG